MDNTKKNKLTPWLCWLAPALLYLIMYAMLTFPSIAVNEIKETLNINGHQLGQLNNAFLYTYVLMQIPVGLLFDRIKSKNLIVFAYLCFALGNGLMAMTDNFYTAIIGRALMGIGGSFSFIGCLYLAQMWMSPKIFGMMIAITESLTGVSAPGFNILFSWIKNNHNYQLIILGITLTSIILSLFSLLVIKQKDTSKKLDKPKLNFVKAIKKVASNKIILILTAYAGLIFVAYGVMTNLWAIKYLQKEFGLSEMKAIALNGLTPIGLIIGCPIIIWISQRYSMLKTLSLASLGLIIVCVFSFFIEIPLYEQIAVLFLLGLFTSSSILPFAIVKNVVNSDLYGASSGLINMSFGGMSILFIEISSYILERTTSFELAVIPVILSGLISFILSLTLFLFLDHKTGKPKQINGGIPK